MTTRKQPATPQPEPEHDEDGPVLNVAASLGAVPPPPLPTVQQAVSAAMRAVKAVGKTGRNEAQRYNFRSIDAFMDAANPALADAGVVIVPRVTQRIVTERPRSGGGMTRIVDLEVTYAVQGPAGDQLPPLVLWGEGADTADKATNKAMTAAYKYALMELLCVPTQDLRDADQDHPDVPSAAEAAFNAREQQAAREAPRELADRLVAVTTQEELRLLWQEASRGRLLHLILPDGLADRNGVALGGLTVEGGVLAVKAAMDAAAAQAAADELVEKDEPSGPASELDDAEPEGWRQEQAAAARSVEPDPREA